MKLIDTIMVENTAFVVYSDGDKSLVEEYNEFQGCDNGSLLIPPHLRLVVVTEDAAPERLPLDLSPSLEKE